MQSHMAILIAYCIGIKTIKHCWILQFLLKNGKKRTFSYKVALKNFHGRAKGGASHRGPPPKYATGHNTSVTDDDYDDMRQPYQGTIISTVTLKYGHGKVGWKFVAEADIAAEVADAILSCIARALTGCYSNIVYESTVNAKKTVMQ